MLSTHLFSQTLNPTHHLQAPSPIGTSRRPPATPYSTLSLFIYTPDHGSNIVFITSGGLLLSSSQDYSQILCFVILSYGAAVYCSSVKRIAPDVDTSFPTHSFILSSWLYLSVFLCFIIYVIE